MGAEVRAGVRPPLRRKTPSRGDNWHLDEVAVTIAGRKHWLWRAVDQDGYVLDEVVQTPPQYKGRQALAEAAQEAGLPSARMITDKLACYAAAKRQIMPEVEHRQHKGLTIERRILICRPDDESG